MNQAFATMNYLVPAVGTTQSFVVNQPFSSGQAIVLDWSQVSQSGQPFVPSGFVMSPHTISAGVKVEVIETGFNILVPQNRLVQMMYPAPSTHRIRVTAMGAGTVNVQFVDYPTIPFFMDV